MCKKAKTVLIPGILERLELFSLIHDQIELNVDEIMPEQLNPLPKILKVLKVKCFKLWTTKFENAEFSKIGARKSRGKKDGKITSESPVALSRLLSGVCENIGKSLLISEFALFGLRLSVRTWENIGKSIEASQVSSLVLKNCAISPKEFEAIFQHIGSMGKLQLLDLSENNLKDNCGYLIGRIISKQGERRDTCKWEGGLRGSIAGTTEGLTEIYLANNKIGDYGWEKILASLVSDTWIRLIDIKNNSISNKAYPETFEMMQQNRSLLVLDMRENPEFLKAFLKVLEMTEKNFDFLNTESAEHERYSQLFELICNEEPLPEIYEIKVFNREKKTKKKKNFSSSTNADRKMPSPFTEKISQECQMLRAENEKLRRQLGKPLRKSRSRLESTQDYIVLAEKKIQEANKVLELVDDF